MSAADKVFIGGISVVFLIVSYATLSLHDLAKESLFIDLTDKQERILEANPELLKELRKKTKNFVDKELEPYLKAENPATPSIK